MHRLPSNNRLNNPCVIHAWLSMCVHECTRMVVSALVRTCGHLQRPVFDRARAHHQPSSQVQRPFACRAVDRRDLLDRSGAMRWGSVSLVLRRVFPGLPKLQRHNAIDRQPAQRKWTSFMCAAVQRLPLFRSLQPPLHLPVLHRCVQDVQAYVPL